MLTPHWPRLTKTQIATQKTPSSQSAAASRCVNRAVALVKMWHRHMASPVFIANDPVQNVCLINLTRLVCQAARPIRQARTPDEDADFWRNKGNEFFKFGDHAKAKQCYTSSIAALPTAAAFGNRALVCTKLKEWTQAETDCSQVCSDFPVHNVSFAP